MGFVWLDEQQDGSRLFQRQLPGVSENSGFWAAASGYRLETIVV